MSSMEALTKLVVGMSRLGDHLLKHKASGTLAAALAFGCGAGLARVFRQETAPTPAAVPQAQAADAARAEVAIRDTAEEEDEGSAVFDKGVYENYVYGYSVRIPRGMVGRGSTPPAPQHGFGIDLDNPSSTEWAKGGDFPESYFYVDGSYNSLEWRRPDDALNFSLKCLRETGKHVRVRSRTATTLGGLRAVRVVALYEKGGEQMVDDEVVSFNDETGVVYTLALSTPLAKYGRDRPVLEELMRGWSLQPVE